MEGRKWNLCAGGEIEVQEADNLKAWNSKQKRLFHRYKEEKGNKNVKLNF